MTESKETFSTRRISVPENFEEVFSHFYFAENQSSDSISKRLLPSFQTILIFSFGATITLNSLKNNKISLNKCLILGPIKRAFEYILPPASKILVANFRNDAFYRFFGNASVAEFLPIHPDELLDENCFTALWNELSKINDPDEQVSFILDFCKPYLKQRNTIARQLANFNEASQNPIKTLSGENKQTERNIQINQKKHFGYSAKELYRYQRFLKAVQMIQDITSRSSKLDWFEVIGECGYYDQSQLIHDFNHYIDLSPTQYLKFQQDICSSIF